MPRADTLLYSALLRMGSRFAAERLPLLGVVGTPLVCYNLAWPATLRRQLEAPPPGAGLAEGAHLLPRLQLQLDTLIQAEEHTREALAEWAALADRFGSRHHASAPGSSLPFAASAVAAAAEEGLALLSRQAQELSDPLLLQELDPQPADSSSQEPAALSLDELAAAVRRDHPALFAATPSSSDTTDSSNSSSSRSEASSSDPSSSCSTALRVEQARALADSLYRRQRFKFEPFEWVYEGLDPLLLPPRLQRRKLAPLTLALVAAGVGRRLGLPLLPVPAEPEGEIVATVVEGPGGGPAGAQGLPMEQLRPDVAQRYAGRSQGLAPASGPWVLLLDSGSGSGSSGDGGPAEAGGGQQWQHVMDASSGELLEAAAAQLKHPDLQLAADWQLLGPLVAWQHMVRTIIQAHQRRGESDLVAHWMYVLLALDTRAPEWDHMLLGSPLSR